MDETNQGLPETLYMANWTNWLNFPALHARKRARRLDIILLPQC